MYASCGQDHCGPFLRTKLNQPLRSQAEEGEQGKTLKKYFVVEVTRPSTLQWGTAKAPAIRYALSAPLKCSGAELMVTSCERLSLVSYTSCWS